MKRLVFDLDQPIGLTESELLAFMQKLLDAMSTMQPGERIRCFVGAVGQDSRSSFLTAESQGLAPLCDEGETR